MLLFLVVLALVVVLFAANMEHRSSFSFIFGHLEEVPVFMALLVAFIAGAADHAAVHHRPASPAQEEAEEAGGGSAAAGTGRAAVNAPDRRAV